MIIPANFTPVFIHGFDQPFGAIANKTIDVLAGSETGTLEARGYVLPGPDRLGAAFATAHGILHSHDLVGPIRDEEMSIRADWDSPVVASVDRSLLRLFGFLGVKVHINGLVQSQDGKKIWLSRRAKDRRAAPLHLDTMVAGGQPHGKSLHETAIMEAEEEVGLSPDYLTDMREVKKLDIMYNTAEGYHRERLVIYDVLLPETFQPVLNDGELIESFIVTPREMRAKLEGSDRFKHNSAVVCEDLLSRLQM
jgi:8-oxo-dGTP pyrophosphatase MutT (NUDIX family)